MILLSSKSPPNSPHLVVNHIHTIFIHQKLTVFKMSSSARSDVADVSGEGQESLTVKIQALGVSSENEELDKVSVRLEEKEVERASPETQRLQGMVDTAEDERLQVETGITAEEKWMIERNLLRQENQELRKQLGETEEQAEEREQDLAKRRNVPSVSGGRDWSPTTRGATASG